MKSDDQNKPDSTEAQSANGAELGGLPVRMIFRRGQGIRHVKTGGFYIVIAEPNPALRLEYCNESFYAYRSFGEDTDHVIWHRRQSEMEDGRFIPANRCQ